jgi:CDP-diacylglycerol--glycerol-3-phosphate 3-phosphatidyltransferase
MSTVTSATAQGVDDAPSWRTIANGLTLSRVVAAPFVIALLLDADQDGSWIAWGAWFVLSITDYADGWFARRRRAVSKAGAFLDPLADKFAVLGAMIALVIDGRYWWLPVGIILARELAMTAYRSIVARHGVSIPARKLAKYKTFSQASAIGFVVFPPTASIGWVADVTLWLSVALTLVSGAQYVVDGRRRTAATAAATSVTEVE